VTVDALGSVGDAKIVLMAHDLIAFRRGHLYGLHLGHSELELNDKLDLEVQDVKAGMLLRIQKRSLALKVFTGHWNGGRPMKAANEECFQVTVMLRGDEAVEDVRSAIAGAAGVTIVAATSAFIGFSLFTEDGAPVPDDGLIVDAMYAALTEIFLLPVPCTVLRGHGWNISCIAELKDGTLVTGSSDATLRLWDAHSGTCLDVKECHERPIRALLVLDDGSVLSASDDGEVKVWLSMAGECEVTIGGPSDNQQGVVSHFLCLAQLSTGLVAAGVSDKGCEGPCVCIWDWKHPRCWMAPRILKGHNGSVSCVLELADGRLASGSEDHTVRIWELKNQGPSALLLEGHTHHVTSIAQLEDGRLASASNDETIRLWDKDTGIESCQLKGHSHFVTCILPLGATRLVSGSRDRTLRVWDLHTNEVEYCLEGHSDAVCCVSQLQDGRLATGSWDSSIRLWGVRYCCSHLALDLHGVVLFRHGTLCYLSMTPFTF